MPAKQRQTLVSRVSADGVGYALRLESGRLTLQVGADLGAVIGLEKAVELYTWYSVTAVFDAESGRGAAVVGPFAPCGG